MPSHAHEHNRAHHADQHGKTGHGHNRHVPAHPNPHNVGLLPKELGEVISADVFVEAGDSHSFFHSTTGGTTCVWAACRVVLILLHCRLPIPQVNLFSNAVLLTVFGGRMATTRCCIPLDAVL